MHSGYTNRMAINRFTVHIQIETRDTEGFAHAPHSLTYHLDHEADDQAAQQNAMTEAMARAKAEWADQANPPGLF